MTEIYHIYRTPKGDHQVRAESDPPPQDWGWELAGFGSSSKERACHTAAQWDAQEDPDPVDRPAHYTGPVPGVECIEVTRHFDFLRGNAIKYIWRAAHKGRYIEDLRKAAWYIQAAIDQGPPQD